MLKLIDEHKNSKIQSIIHFISLKYPAKIAIQDDKNTITYQKLDYLSDVFASHLVLLGVLPGDFIPIIAHKSINMLIALLGILKADAAYIPIAADLPQETIEKILTQINSNIMCVDDDLLSTYHPNQRAQCIPLSFMWNQKTELTQTILPLIDKRNEYAYMVFTSGSTGEPKGVLITHNNLVATYQSWESVYQLSASDKHLQMANISFDVFAGDWIRALCSGATLVLCHKDTLLSPEKLYQLIESEKITIAEFVPAILRILMKYCERKKINLSTFRLLLCGSDTWIMSEYRKVKSLCKAQTRIISSYGLTETTIDSTYFEEKNESFLKDEDLVPLGIPFPHVFVNIVNEYFEAVQIGDSGELLIGGDGVAAGYFKNNTHQQERFIVDLDSNQGTIFRTGDYVRQLNDGNIYFHGRNIHCVNVRGIRIDLNIVESILKGHPNIEQALLLTRDVQHGEIELDIYLVSHDDSLSYFAIKNYIMNKIKNFPFPRKIFIVQELCLTFNNKINRKYSPDHIRKVLTDDKA